MMLTPQGTIKLMDFGLGRAGDERSLTKTGATLGSLNYVSPEQVKGEATDGRSDLYSVGVCLYEFVTGQRPFTSTSGYSLMAAQIKEKPKPPLELNPALPLALNEIILMAIAKEPAERFQTADAFNNALSSLRVPSSASLAAPPAAPGTATSSNSLPTAAVLPNAPTLAVGGQEFCPGCGAGRCRGRRSRSCGGRLPASSPAEPPSWLIHHDGGADRPCCLGHRWTLRSP